MLTQTFTIYEKVDIIFLFTVFLIQDVFCQTEKRSSMIGGSGHINLSDGFYLHVSPSYGYFLMDNFAIGAEVSYAFYEYERSAVVAGPFVRYYIGNGANRLLFEGDLAYGDRFYRYNLTNTLTAGVGVGYTRFLTQQVGLEAILKYQNMDDLKGYFNERLFVALRLQFFLPPRLRG